MGDIGNPSDHFKYAELFRVGAIVREAAAMCGEPIQGLDRQRRNAGHVHAGGRTAYRGGSNAFRTIAKRTTQGAVVLAALAVAIVLWPVLNQTINSAVDVSLPKDLPGLARLVAGGMILLFWSQVQISKSLDRLHSP